MATKTKQIAFRISEFHYSEIEEWSKKLNIKRTDFVREVMYEKLKSIRGKYGNE